MNVRRIDALSRALAHRHARRSVLGGLTGLAAAALTASRAESARSPSGRDGDNALLRRRQDGDVGARVVEQFYLWIATYEYMRAYHLLGTEFQAQQSFNQFINGYTDTAYAQVEVTGAGPVGDQVEVQVVITAWHNDGSIHRFSGAYAVGGPSGAERIQSASISEEAPPADGPPLCAVADLDATFRRQGAGAGSQFFALLVTNHSDGVCLAAGVPHFRVDDANGCLQLESHTEQTEPFDAVPLPSGAQAAARFRWANWCGPEPAYPLTLDIAIPGDTDRLTVPLTTTEGPVEMPGCIGPVPAQLGVQAFSPPAENA